MRTKEEIADRFAPTAELDGFRRFFFVGIGGAGMSGIAAMMLRRGLTVFGSDAVSSPVIQSLVNQGAAIGIGHSAERITEGMAVVLTDAIDLKTSPEVRRAEELGLPIFRRSQVLGWLLKDKKVIAVSGTHGKTTTSGMLGVAMRAAGMDPTIVVGAEVPDFGGATVEGSGLWAVVEACEAYDSFHDLQPEVMLLTNLEPDHLDFHGSWENLKESVNKFARKIPLTGALFYCVEDKGAREIAEEFGGTAIAYDAGEWPNPRSGTMRLPGRHNWLNAQGALMVAARVSNKSMDDLLPAVANYGGAERRLQIISDGDITVIDDYAHHPTEIRASISALKSRYTNRRLVVVFQPHLYSRTRDFLPQFAKELSEADYLVLTDIYPAREEPIAGMSSGRIAEMVSCPVDYVPSRHLLARKVMEIVRPGDVVVGMGAGNIASFAGQFVAELRRPAKKRVAILYGGDSAEREVSLHTGRGVYNALKETYTCELLDASELLLGKGSISALMGDHRPDVAFLAVHGTNAEDGAIQGFCNLLHIPHTGSGIQASALAMDKQMTKMILREKGLPVPEGVVVKKADWLHDAERVLNDLPVALIDKPSIVKPNQQGSTVGLSFTHGRDELRAGIEKALHYDDVALVEERVAGMETSTPVLGDRVLLPVEIAPASGVYDFESKYTPGATEEICPARLDPAVLATLQDLALRAHQALGCEGATRTDMIVDGSSAVILEVNTLPGLTPTSLLPKSAETCGVSYQELCVWLVEDALRRARAIH